MRKEPPSVPKLVFYTATRAGGGFGISVAIFRAGKERRTQLPSSPSPRSPPRLSDRSRVRVCGDRERSEMGQQSLIYSFVARGTVILAEYTEFQGNFTSIAAQCLQKLPSSNNRFTYNCDGHTFNYLVEDGYSEPLDSIASCFCLGLVRSNSVFRFDPVKGGSSDWFVEKMSFSLNIILNIWVYIGRFPFPSQLRMDHGFLMQFMLI